MQTLITVSPEHTERLELEIERAEAEIQDLNAEFCAMVFRLLHR